MAKCSKCGSVACMCGSPNHMIDPEMASVGLDPQVTKDLPLQSNQKGSAKPLFNPMAQASAESIFGTTEQRQMSMPDAPVFFKDQTGDGQITQADVIKARIEGYKK